jgi:hypothetical protein
MNADELKAGIIADLGRFTHDPYGFVLWAYPWGVEGTALAKEDGPDVWQREQLEAIGADLQADPFKIIQDATASGHGIGKSAEVSWLIHWAIMTHEDTRGVVTANTDTQLRTKTWAELAKWHNLLRFQLLRDMFVWEASSIHSTEPGKERTWRIDAIPWSAHNTEAFAGLHNAGKRTIYLFDEASGIDDLIWDTASGALTDAETEILWIAYGNPLRNTGRFREAISGSHRKQWRHRQIDSRTVKRTNKALLEKWIEVYGDDSDYVRTRIKGQFPRASTTQFIASDVVQTARKREAIGLTADPIIFGVDVARFGDDDSVLAIRRGRDARSLPWKRWHGADTMMIAGEVAMEAQRWHPDAIFVDVGAMGAGVIDRLNQMGVENVFEVNFGSAGREVDWGGNVRVKTRNKRTEMWTTLRHWLRLAAIPDEDDLEAELIGPEYGYGPDQISIQLERKEDMKKRGLASPDAADALALTFAEFIQPREGLPGHLNPENYGRRQEYDRYAELDSGYNRAEL